jgi:hypothetical protein
MEFPSPPQIRLDIKPCAILLFDPETAGAFIRLDKLALIETAPEVIFRDPGWRISGQDLLLDLLSTLN